MMFLDRFVKWFRHDVDDYWFIFNILGVATFGAAYLIVLIIGRGIDELIVKNRKKKER